MKRFFFVALLVLSTAVCVGGSVALAAEGFVPIAPIPGLTEGVDATSGQISGFLNNLYIFSIGVAVILAIGMIIWGGLEYALSEAITSKTEGRKKIVNALFGLVLVLSPALVFAIINPAILRLDVNFPALKTGWNTWGPASGADPRRPTEDIEAGRTWCYQLLPATTPPTYSRPCYATSAECIRAKTAAQRANPGTVSGAACGQSY